MPVMQNPPAIVQQQQEQTPLMSEMMSRAVASQPPEKKSWLEQVGTPAFASGTGADWLSTALALQQGAHEKNAMINWVPGTAGKVALGAGIDLAGYLLARKLLHNHPKILNAGLLGNGIYRTGVAAHNFNTMRQGNK